MVEGEAAWVLPDTSAAPAGAFSKRCKKGSFDYESQTTSKTWLANCASIVTQEDASFRVLAS